MMAAQRQDTPHVTQSNNPFLLIQSSFIVRIVTIFVCHSVYHNTHRA